MLFSKLLLYFRNEKIKAVIFYTLFVQRVTQMLQIIIVICFADKTVVSFSGMSRNPLNNK